ncbi:MAG: hypothetical protein ACRDD7_05625 [Peptostreptococcaceae bacterium]
MNKDNHEEFDLKIKNILKENDDTVVPQKISKGIDEALQNLDSKNNFSKKKIAMVISLGLLLSFIMLTPLGADSIKALKDTIYTYIPSLGATIKVDNLIYILPEPITKSIDKRKITLTEVYYDTENELIIVDVEGSGKFPQDKAILKINNKKIKSIEGSIYDMSNTGLNISWAGTYFFKYNKSYNNEDVEFKLPLENRDTVEIKCNLKEAKSIKDITALGPSDTKKDISITGVINEKEDILEVNFLDSLSEKNIGVFYEDIILIDAENKEVLGKKIDTANGNYNKFKFDINNLKMPFKINIPSINIYMQEKGSSSEIMELPIPKENEEIIIDMNVSLEIKDKLIEGSNTEVNVESIKRESEECTITLKYASDEKRDKQLMDCVIVPAGKSIPENGEDWFESGLSGSLYNEDGSNIKELTFKLPYLEDDELYIKIRGSEYKIIGPWEIMYYN